MKTDDSKSPGALRFGPSADISKAYIVALFDPDTGAVIKRHSVVVMKGGKDRGVENAIAAAFASTKAFYARIAGDEVAIRKMKASGQTLFPIENLKAAVSEDHNLLEADLAIDPKTGQLVEVRDERDTARHVPKKQKPGKTAAHRI